MEKYMVVGYTSGSPVLIPDITNGNDGNVIISSELSCYDIKIRFLGDACSWEFRNRIKFVSNSQVVEVALSEYLYDLDQAGFNFDNMEEIRIAHWGSEQGHYYFRDRAMALLKEEIL